MAVVCDIVTARFTTVAMGVKMNTAVAMTVAVKMDAFDP